MSPEWVSSDVKKWKSYEERDVEKKNCGVCIRVLSAPPQCRLAGCSSRSSTLEKIYRAVQAIRKRNVCIEVKWKCCKQLLVWRNGEKISLSEKRSFLCLKVYSGFGGFPRAVLNPHLSVFHKSAPNYTWKVIEEPPATPVDKKCIVRIDLKITTHTTPCIQFWNLQPATAALDWIEPISLSCWLLKPYILLQFLFFNIIRRSEPDFSWVVLHSGWF